MFDNFLLVAGQVATLFLMMGAGFALRKRGALSDETVSQMSYVLLHVVAPCIIIESFFLERDLEKLRGMGIAALAACAYFALAAGLSWPLFRRNEYHERPDTGIVLRFASAYPNAGFMGFPLISGVLGDRAMVYASVFVVVFTLMQWTHGVVTMGGPERASIRKAAVNPGTVSLAVGLALFLLGIVPPKPVKDAVSLIADLNTPLAMLVIGVSMAKSDFRKLFRTPALYASAALKLAAFPALVTVALAPFKLDPLIYATTVILSATPTAGVTAIFANRFNRDSATAAQTVSLATLLSIVTIPLFAAIVITGGIK